VSLFPSLLCYLLAWPCFHIAIAVTRVRFPADALFCLFDVDCAPFLASVVSSILAGPDFAARRREFNPHRLPFLQLASQGLALTSPRGVTPFLQFAYGASLNCRKSGGP
jgi:hypothetical protein